MPSGSTFCDEVFPFGLDERLIDMAPACQPHSKELLVGAQSRHEIFYEDIVVKAFHEAEKAHRGQVTINFLASVN